MYIEETDPQVTENVNEGLGQTALAWTVCYYCRVVVHKPLITKMRSGLRVQRCKTQLVVYRDVETSDMVIVFSKSEKAQMLIQDDNTPTHWK